MPTEQELEAMAQALFGRRWNRDPTTLCAVCVGEQRGQVMLAAIALKRNDYLHDILMVMDNMK